MFHTAIHLSFSLWNTTVHYTSELTCSSDFGYYNSSSLCQTRLSHWALRSLMPATSGSLTTHTGHKSTYIFWVPMTMIPCSNRLHMPITVQLILSSSSLFLAIWKGPPPSPQLLYCSTKAGPFPRANLFRGKQ